MHNLKYKLSKQLQNDLFVKLAKSLASLKNPVESAELLKDLISESEMLMLSRRLWVAELLLEGQTYREIRMNTKASPGTIARIQTWLELYGEGYRSVIGRISKESKNKDQDTNRPFGQIKRKYPMYFWPQLLLEELVKTANKREKQRLAKVVGQMREKTVLSKQLTKLLQVGF